MFEVLYTELNLLCVIMLVYIFMRMRMSVDQQADNLAFHRVLWSVIIILLLDSIWMLVEGKSGRVYYVLNMLANMFFLIQTAVVTFSWLRFVEGKLNRPLFQKSPEQYLVRLPLLVLIVLSVTSPWTKLLFYIDADNIYHRGILHFVQVLIGYSYIVVATVHIIIDAVHTVYIQKRMEILNLMLMFMLPALGSISNLLWYKLPTIWPFAALGLLAVFINLQNFQISTDGLTGLNNRRQFNNQMNSMVSDSHKAGGIMILLMMDINSFKRINDTYGHVEGDNALVETSELLKRACRGRDVFLARYGGDEFAIVGYFSSPQQAEQLKRDIQQQFDERNRISTTAYRLTLSVGIGQYLQGHYETVTEIIAEADRMLYEEKQRLKMKHAQT